MERRRSGKNENIQNWQGRTKEGVRKPKEKEEEYVYEARNRIIRSEFSWLVAMAISGKARNAMDKTFLPIKT